MGLIVEWRDPDGVALSRANDPTGQLDRLVAGELELGSSPMLWGIDPFLDTFFNSHQCEQLALELRQTSDGLETESLGAVLDLVAACRDEPHTVIVFIGD